MRSKRLCTVIAGICLVLVLAALPFVSACAKAEAPPAPATPAPGPATPTPKPSEKTWELKYTSFRAATMVDELTPIWFAEELQKRTGGRVKTTCYHSGTLVPFPETREALKSGIADLGVINTMDLDILEGVGGLPFICPSEFVASAVYEALYYKGLLDEDFYNFKLLWTGFTDPGYLIIRDKNVARMEDLDGMKMRARGKTQVATLEAWGCSPISLSAKELYTAFERGTVDGCISMPTWAKSVNLFEVAKYWPWHPITPGGASPVMMSMNTWNSFPPDIQVIIEQLSSEALFRFKELKLTRSQWRKELEEMGFVVYELDPAELASLKKATEPVVDEYIAGLEAKGLPGKEVIETVNWVVGLYGYPGW